MENKRNVLVFVAAGLMLAQVLLDVGGPSLLGSFGSPPNVAAQIDAQLAGQIPDAAERSALVKTAGPAQTPPGLGIRYLALLDGIMLYSLMLLCAPMILPPGLWSKIQGVVTLILSIALLLTSIGMIIAAFVLLMIMVSLVMAPPFGLIAYLVIWGAFSRGTAATILGAKLFLTLGTAFCLFVASPAYFKVLGIMLALATALLCGVVLGFLHGLVPVFLVSIVDAIGALIFAVIALVWAICLMVGSILSIVKAIVSA